MVKFANAFSIAGVGRVLPAGVYQVLTDEELIEGLSFPVYRRIATMILALHNRSAGSRNSDEA
jgi:hypothetical protein